MRTPRSSLPISITPIHPSIYFSLSNLIHRSSSSSKILVLETRNKLWAILQHNPPAYTCHPQRVNPVSPPRVNIRTRDTCQGSKRKYIYLFIYFIFYLHHLKSSFRFSLFRFEFFFLVNFSVWVWAPEVADLLGSHTPNFTPNNLPIRLFFFSFHFLYSL